MENNQVPDPEFVEIALEGKPLERTLAVCAVVLKPDGHNMFFRIKSNAVPKAELARLLVEAADSLFMNDAREKAGLS